MNKLFGTDGIRGLVGHYPMTPEIMLKLGKSSAKIFKSNQSRHKILIGKDTRISGYILESALTSGICSMGLDVLLVGPLPTPAIAHLAKNLNASAGIVISASHNPAQDNGVKFFSNKGIKLSDEIEKKIESLVFKNIFKSVPSEKTGKAYRLQDAKSRYIEFAKSAIKNNLQGFKIVLDCANGAAYAVAPIIFEELGAQTIILNNKPDGLNINKDCGALHPKVVSKEVKKHNANIGIAFDGDADRVIIVDENGSELNGDHIMALCAIDMLKNNNLNKKTLVATVYSNLGLDKTIEKAGGKVVRVKNGDRYVIEEMLKNNYNFGGERSGHIIFSDYTTTGDGIIAALRVLDIMKKTNKKLSELKTCLKEFPQVLINVKVKKKIPFEQLPNVNKAIKQAQTILKNNGRLLIRYSGTENIARVMIEGKDKKLITKLANNIAGEIKKCNS